LKPGKEDDGWSSFGVCESTAIPGESCDQLLIDDLLHSLCRIGARGNFIKERLGSLRHSKRELSCDLDCDIGRDERIFNLTRDLIDIGGGKSSFAPQ
jgi:hypothetical protein